jgi:hypothetical protein
MTDEQRPLEATDEQTPEAPEERDSRASDRARSILELVPSSDAHVRRNSNWILRRKSTFDLTDLYGDR